MSWVDKKAVKEIKARLATYAMKVVHEDGLYRHLYCYSTTDELPGNCSFEVVTWPGCATIYGDWCGAHTISREPDMLQDFLNVRGVSYGYWAEKMRLVGRHQQIIEPSEKACDLWLKAQIAAIKEDYDLTHTDLKDLREQYNWCRDGNNIFDWQKLQKVGDFFTENGDIIELSINDAWELDFTEYTYEFLIACEGLRFAANSWVKRQRGVVEQ